MSISSESGPNIEVIKPITNHSGNNPEYHKIVKVINSLAGSGSLFLGSGYCIAMCDLLQPILLHYGIKCNIVEVTLTISFNQSKDDRSTLAIGFNNVTDDSPNSVETHVVLVTDTNPPFIIDPSISHKLPPGRGVIIAACEDTKDRHLVDFINHEDNIRVTYIQKVLQKVPSAHQSSIVNRIYKDYMVEKRLKLLTTLLVVAMTVSSLNFVRGSVDFYKVYFDTENYWGPTHIKQIIDRLDRLENSADRKNKPE